MLIIGIKLDKKILYHLFRYTGMIISALTYK